MSNWLQFAQSALPRQTPHEPVSTPAMAAVHGGIPVFDEAVCASENPARAALHRPLHANERQTILHWLDAIEETDAAAIAHVLAQCDANLVEREGILRLASGIRKTGMIDDERRRCTDCANLTKRRLCIAGAHQSVHPVTDILMRCEGYQPGPDDPDRRSGRERWFPASVKHTLPPAAEQLRLAQ